MDFGLLPPEVNSARMYAGPGSESMLAAAKAWDGLAAVLNSSAVSYAAVISGLAVESWLGSASASMAAAAAPYAVWLSAAAVVAEQTANQARTASAAFEAAFAQTVPPPLIADNREQLMTLVSTNRLGQNTPAIEAIQAEYAEMWAQDAAAMFTYAGASEAASTLTPFIQPSQAADPAGPAAQAAALSRDAGQGATTGVAAPGQLPSVESSGRAAPAAALDPLLSALGIPIPIGELDFAAAYIATIGSASLTLAAVNTARPWSFQSGLHGATDSSEPVPPQTHGVAQDDPAGAPAAGGGAASAVVGHAALLGGLTVPHSWTMAAPEIRLAVESLPGAEARTISPDMSGAPAGLLSGMALAGLAGRGAADTGKASGTTSHDQEQPQREPTVVVIQKPSPPQPPRANPPR